MLRALSSLYDMVELCRNDPERRNSALGRRPGKVYASLTSHLTCAISTVRKAHARSLQKTEFSLYNSKQRVNSESLVVFVTEGVLEASFPQRHG